jgi:type IX secretion system substrate protein
MKQIITLLGIVLMMSFIVSASVINVPADQPTIQTGINAASNGDTVLVADSTYYENINFMGKAITVASLFLIDGDTTHRYNTIIDGSQPSNPNNGSVVSFVSGEDTNSVLCGFTITNGTGTIFNYGYQVRSGGGVLCLNSGASIENNKIINNSVTHNSAGGGGISVLATSGIVHANAKYNEINNNIVNGSSKSEGGGILFWSASGKIIGNVINNNSNVNNNSWARGGGVYLYSSATPTTSVIFKDNQVCNNLASGIGTSVIWGALGGGLITLRANALIHNNIITNNEISGAVRAGGAGIYFGFNSNNKSISRNFICQNSCIQGEGLGGGIIIAVSNPELNNNIISENSAFYGSGIYTDNSSPEIINNTIINNIAAGNGGGLYNADNSNTIIMNSIIWGNQAQNYPSIQPYSGTVEVVYSDVQGTTVWPGIGNINADPLFTPDSVHLSSASPCIGKGIDTWQIGGVWYDAPDTDFEGDPRPWPANSSPDIGADEDSLGGPNAMINDINLSSKYIRINTDTLGITSDILNPDSLNLQIYARIQSINNTFVDSVLMYNDGNHDDGQANDTIWGGYFGPVSTEDMYKLNIIVKDFSTTNDSLISLPEFFTSIGPLMIDNCVEVFRIPDRIFFNFTLRNDGDSTAAENVQARISTTDPYVIEKLNDFQNFGNIAAGQTANSSAPHFGVRTMSLPDTHTFVFTAEISSNTNYCWSGSISVQVVTGISDEDNTIPKVFALNQNYPNPFNPNTTIGFSIPKTEFVTLKVYNLLGQEMADLVSKKLTPGNYKYTWDASQYASGVYYYKLEAGDPSTSSGQRFIKTKKLILMK